MVAYAVKRRVGGAVHIIKVTGHRDQRGATLFIRLVRCLHRTGHQLGSQKSGRDIPAIALGVGVVDLHPCLVEVLDGSNASGRATIWLFDLTGEWLRPPEPGSTDRTAGNRLILASPGRLKIRISGSLRVHRKRQQANCEHNNDEQPAVSDDTSRTTLVGMHQVTLSSRFRRRCYPSVQQLTVPLESSTASRSTS